MAETTNPPNTPFRSLLRLFAPEFPEIRSLLAFSVVVGLLSLATPIAVEALVNTVAFAAELQPVVILAIVLFACLTLAAVVLALEAVIVELIQRRIFARAAETLARQLPRTLPFDTERSYGPELINRFFEVPILQKIGAKLLLDGVTAALSALVGLAVLAFYHPLLLAFGIVLVALLGVILFVLGRGGVRTALEESTAKYATADWLEELMRHPLAFRYGRGREVAAQRGDALALTYLDRRRRHYRVVFRQLCGALLLQAIMSTLLLGLGGWLVKIGQLSLGQLVASWLIVSVVLASVAKLGGQLESVYDILVSARKLTRLLDLPTERTDGHVPPDLSGSVALVELEHTGVTFAEGRAATLHLAAGDGLAIIGPSGSGKTLLLELLLGLRPPAAGRIEYDGIQLRSLRLDAVRTRVALARRGEVVAGTVADNVRFGGADLDVDGLRRKLVEVGLWAAVQRLPEGLETRLSSFGAPLSSTQADLLVLARALAAEPAVLMIDGLLDTLDDAAADHVVRSLTADRARTVIIATQREDIARRIGRTLRLADPTTRSLTLQPT